MSWAAGTLVTTHNATYIPPRFMPGYRGHCPTLKYDYGETYGNATSKYFQDYRSEVLNSSRFPYSRGGEFPTYYTHNPDLVIGNRTRTRDRWLSAPKYELSNVNHDRKEELYQFDKMAQGQREHYCDKSGTVKKVDYFQLPVKAQDQFKKQVPFMILSRRYSQEPEPLQIKTDRIAHRAPILPQFATKRSVRERGMRDVYFEER